MRIKNKRSFYNLSIIHKYRNLKYIYVYKDLQVKSSIWSVFRPENIFNNLDKVLNRISRISLKIEIDNTKSSEISMKGRVDLCVNFDSIFNEANKRIVSKIEYLNLILKNIYYLILDKIDLSVCGTKTLLSQLLCSYFYLIVK